MQEKALKEMCELIEPLIGDYMAYELSVSDLFESFTENVNIFFIGKNIYY